MHEPLAKRATTDNRATIVILQGSGQNLTRRGTILVNQYGNLQILRRAHAVGILTQLTMVAILGVDNQLLLVQELVGDEDGLIEEPARVAAQVENQFRHPLTTQFQQG